MSVLANRWTRRSAVFARNYGDTKDLGLDLVYILQSRTTLGKDSTPRSFLTYRPPPQLHSSSTSMDEFIHYAKKDKTYSDLVFGKCSADL